MPTYSNNTNHDSHPSELRLEGVTTSVNYDDVLDITLGLNHGHFDNLIVVTDHNDKATQQVCKKHSVTCVVSDLFSKNGRPFNKGAAINAGFNHFKHYGWRLHFDVDVILPDNCRRLLFNHTHLDPEVLYGATRRDVVGWDQLNQLVHSRIYSPQHVDGTGLSAEHNGALGNQTSSSSSSLYVDSLRGYCPIGFFQLWNWTQQRPYPHSLGSACSDDITFAASWPLAKRQLLPTVMCYHLVKNVPSFGENWNGVRKQPRFK